MPVAWPSNAVWFFFPSESLLPVLRMFLLHVHLFQISMWRPCFSRPSQQTWPSAYSPSSFSGKLIGMRRAMVQIIAARPSLLRIASNSPFFSLDCHQSRNTDRCQTLISPPLPLLVRKYLLRTLAQSVAGRIPWPPTSQAQQVLPVN